ncbi:MAG TPA: zf-TFIIB domain-containing protein [Kofleriaceae bacterium]|nr:zf-TFIIB domain-containing protein [Kofleriaceae bacterium]
MMDGRDPFGDDPYRGGAFRELPWGRCPRCSGGLAEHRSRRVCPDGCGSWLTAASLRGAVTFETLAACELDVGSLIGRPFPPAPCPECWRTMEVRIHGAVVFDFCGDHGVWLDRGELAGFECAFAPGDRG